jgi:hypothetical protein
VVEQEALRCTESTSLGGSELIGNHKLLPGYAGIGGIVIQNNINYGPGVRGMPINVRYRVGKIFLG